jgi:uncharacterized protein YqgV (UPF0045/DUF77 family)
MIASAQIAVYLLRQDRLSPAIEAVQQALRDNHLSPEPGPMNTYVVGDDQTIFAAFKDAFRRASSMAQLVMTVTLSNACPIPDRCVRGA